MTSLDTDRQRLDALLSDLKARAFRPSQEAYQGMQELGQFVEEAHAALGKCFEFDPSRIHVDAWHVEMKKHGYECHAAQFGDLKEIYGYRNISSHPNEEKHSITLDRVRRRFDDITERLPELASRLTRHPFVDKLFEVQRCSQHQRRASTLGAAIAETGDVQDYLQIVLDYALPMIPEEKQGFLSAPQDKQLALVLAILGRRCSSTDNDVLNSLAGHLLSSATVQLQAEPLREWLQRYGELPEPGMAARRLPVIRVTLDQDPRSSRGLLVRDAMVLEPIIPRLADYLPEFPVSVADISDLHGRIVFLLNSIRSAMTRAAERSPPGAEPHHWQEFVLELEVPCELAALEFESLSSRPGRNLAMQFRCVTLHPFPGCDALLPLRGLDDPIVHPRHQQNAVAVWGTSDSERLYAESQGRDCLFTGPTAWSAGTKVPPVVDAFEGFPGAVVCQADDEIEGLDPLFGSEDERSWPELLDRVTDLRRNGAELKVLWNDPSYGPLLAESI